MDNGNKSAFAAILAKKTTVTVEGVELSLSRPDSNAIDFLLEEANAMSAAIANGEQPVKRMADLCISCIAACLPDLCLEGKEHKTVNLAPARELFAASGGLAGDLSLAAAKLCGFDELAVKQAYEEGKAGENAADLGQPTS